MKVHGTLAADGWAVTFGTTRKGLDAAAARPGPSSLYQMYSLLFLSVHPSVTRWY